MAEQTSSLCTPPPQPCAHTHRPRVAMPVAAHGPSICSRSRQRGPCAVRASACTYQDSPAPRYSTCRRQAPCAWYQSPRRMVAAGLAAMSRTRQSSLRLLGVNVDALRSKANRRTLFSVLQRKDRRDTLPLLEAHHSSQANSEECDARVAARAMFKRSGLNSGASAPIFPGLAVRISHSAASRLSDIQLRQSCPAGRSLGEYYNCEPGILTLSNQVHCEIPIFCVH